MLLQGVRARAECYETWIDKVKSALEAKGEDRLEFDDIKEMLEEAQTRKYPETELFEALTLTVEEADKCQTVAQQLGNKKVRTRTRGVLDSKSRLTVEELQLFRNQLETLPVKISGKDSVETLLENVEKFQEKAQKMLNMKNEDLEELNKLIETGTGLDVDLSELSELKAKAKQMNWLEEAKDILEDPMADSFDHIKKVMDSGMDLPPSPQVRYQTQNFRFHQSIFSNFSRQKFVNKLLKMFFSRENLGKRLWRKILNFKFSRQNLDFLNAETISKFFAG